MQECRLTILVNWRREVWGKVGYYPILLITHENGESGCCEDWLFCGPCYFNRDLQWNVFIHTEATAQASSSRTELWSCSLLKGLGGSGPKQREQTPFTTSPPHSPFLFQTVGMFVPRYSNIRARSKKAEQSLVVRCYGFERLGHSHKDFKENNPRNVIVLFAVHLGEAFLSLPTSCQRELQPMKWIWNQSPEKIQLLTLKGANKFSFVTFFKCWIYVRFPETAGLKQKTCTSISFKLFFYP